MPRRTFRRVTEDKEEIRKVEVANERGHDRHDQVVDCGIDDFSEGGANDDTHCQINHIAAYGKGFELFEHVKLLV